MTAPWFRREGLRDLLFVGAGALALTAMLLAGLDLLTYDHPSFPQPWDHHKYLHMAAEEPWDFHIAPYCWRVVVPLLAGALPFDLQWNFLVISAVGVWLTGVAIYYLSKLSGFGKPLALLGMLLFFSLGWATNFVLYDFWLPDALSFLVITLAIYSIVAGKDLLFVVLLAVGVGVKESVIFVAPLYYSLNARRLVDVKLAARAVGLASPAIAILLGLRMVIPAFNDDPEYIRALPRKLWLVQNESSSYHYRELFATLAASRFRALSLNTFGTIKLYTVGAFGVLVTLLPLFGTRRTLLRALRFTPFLLLVYAQLLFAVNTERLIVAGFPAMILLALDGLENLSTRLRIRPEYLYPLPALLILLNIVNANETPGIVEHQLLIVVVYMTLIVLLRVRLGAQVA